MSGRPPRTERDPAASGGGDRIEVVRNTSLKKQPPVSHGTPEVLAALYAGWDRNGLSPLLEARLVDRHLLDAVAQEQFHTWLEWFRTEIDRQGAHRTVEVFLDEGERFEDRCDRWAMVRILELVSDPGVKDRVRPSWVPDSPHVRRRPLRPLELCVIRLIAVNAVGGDTKPEVLNRWASVGALEAGAAPGELERIMIDDLERDASGQVVAFHAPGTSRDVTSGFPVTVPRTLTVPRWARPGFTTIADDDSDVQAGRPVLQGRITRSERAGAVASKMSMRFRHVIEYAGLHHDATVEPLSIRNGAARLVRDAHGIEAAARQLGHTSIDFVMGEIGLAVRRPVRPRRP